MSQSPRSVVVISSHIALLERLVTENGFTVVGAADLAVNGERLVELFEPTYIVLDTDLPGEQGFSPIERLRRVAPNAHLLVLVGQQWDRAHASRLGVSAVIARDDLLDLGRILLDLERSSSGAAGRLERRSGRDRRVVQDWSKIGWEYRRETRRADDRRDEASLV